MAGLTLFIPALLGALSTSPADLDPLVSRPSV